MLLILALVCRRSLAFWFCRWSEGFLLFGRSWLATKHRISIARIVGESHDANARLPADVESAYRAAAQARGVPLDALVREVLIEQQPAPIAERSVYKD